MTDSISYVTPSVSFSTENPPLVASNRKNPSESSSTPDLFYSVVTRTMTSEQSLPESATASPAATTEELSSRYNVNSDNVEDSISQHFAGKRLKEGKLLIISNVFRLIVVFLLALLIAFRVY